MKGISFELQRFAIYGTSYNDTIRNTTSRNVIYAYAGNDSIYNSAQRVTIFGGDGDDSISHVYAGSPARYASIDGGAGNDYIYNYTTPYSTINGGDGNDTINVIASSGHFINGGSGSDRISITSNSAVMTPSTLKGGTGNDTIYGDSNSNYGNLYQYAYGDGSDVIYNISNYDTISIGGASSWSTVRSGSNVIVSVAGSGAMTLVGASGKSFKVLPTPGPTVLRNTVSGTSFYGTSSADTMSNTGATVSVYGGTGNDSIYNSGQYSKIYAGDGADTVSLSNGISYVTVDGGAGDDKIIGRVWDSSINGGAGADLISLGSGDFDDTTIVGGTGNDTIYADGYDGYNTFVYAAGDGFDTVYYANSYDTLKITSGSYTTTRSGSDLIVSVGSGNSYTGAVTFKNTSSVKIIPTEDGVTINNTISSTSVNGTGYNDSIRNSGSRVTITAGDGSDTINNAPSDYNEQVTINGGAGNDYIYNGYVNSVSVYGGDGDDYIRNESAWYSTVEAGAGNDTVISSYRAYHDYITGGAGNDRISLTSGVGEGYNGYNTVAGGLGDDVIYGNTLGTQGNVYKYATGDGNDTIYGFTSKDTLSISGSYTTMQSGSDIVYSVGSGSVRLVSYTPTPTILKNSANSTVFSGTSGNDTMSNTGTTVTINAGTGNDSIYSNNGTYSRAYVTINAGDGDDTIVGRFGDSSISGGAGADRISMSGDVDRATINGGAGNDIIYLDGYLGNDGGNVIQYTTGDGNDTVYGFKNSDSIKISGSYNASQVGSDYIYYIGTGSVRLVNYTAPEPTGTYITNSTSSQTLLGTAGNDTIKNIYSYSTGGDTVSIEAGDGRDTIYNDYGWYLTINAGAGNDTITDSRGNRTSINAGAGDDIVSLSSSSGIVTVRGGTGNDTIYGDSVRSNGVVYAYDSGDGNDVIYNFRSNDTVTGATYTSVVSGKNVILNMSGGGSVTLVGASTIPVETFTEEADSYTNTTSGTLLSALGGNDTIINSAARVTINAGDGDDRISNTGASLNASMGTGDDSIYSSGDYSYIDLGDGADSIYAYDNDYVTVNAGAGNDVINGSFYSSKISGGAGADKISIISGANTIDGGDGADTISAYGGSISGGAGDDRISLNGSYSGRIVNGGTGDDVIYGATGASYGTRYEYAYGDGNDIIYNYSSNDTVSIAGTSQYSTMVSGGNKIISVIGSGAMTLSGASKTSLVVKGGTYVPNSLEGAYITNSTSNVTLNGTKNNDTIENIYDGGGDTVSIDAGAGDDIIYNDYGYYITINAGDGNDTITSYIGSSNSIDGGAGADIISLSASDGLTVVKGGTGNDTIYGDSAAQLFQYANGDGYDVISGYSANDSITITGGDWSKSTVGNDVIISISNTDSTVQTGAITLSGAKGKAINVYPAKGIPTIPPEPIPAVTQQEVIQKFMGVLDTVNTDGIGRLNQAVSIASGGYFSNISAAINQMVTDCQNASSANDFLVNYCGINLSNSDTGAVIGSDMGGSATKTAQSIVTESGSVNNFTGNSFTTNGLTVQLASFDYHMNPTNISYSSLSNNTQRYIWQAYQTWWVSGGLNLVAQSYGNNYSFGTGSSATVNKIYFGFERENSGTMATTYFWTNRNSGEVYQLAMTVNMRNYDSLIIGNSDGKISGRDDFYLDRVLAHEFTHAVMAANINYFGGLPNLIAEGMAEMTHGTDDDRYDEILDLANSPSALRNALSINYDSYDSYAGGYMFLHYLAKQSADHSGTSSVSGGGSMSAIISGSNNAGGSVTTQRGVTIKSNVLTADKTFDEDMIDLSTYPSTVTKVNATALTTGTMIIGNTKADSISAGKGNDTVSGNTGNDTILGGAGNDILFGDAGNDNVNGDAGNDTISGGYGNDTLTGGAGSDVFIHMAGNDFITDYTARQDKIKLVNTAILSSSISGSNVVLTTSNGTINVKGGKGKSITVIDKDGEETTTVYGGASASDSSVAGLSVKSGVLTATAAFTGDEINLADYATNVTKVNASALTRGVSIIGGAGNNSLKGGSGADTLSGGAGNDTLYGGAGSDVFVYDGGSSYIADYTAGQDKIKLASGSITGASLKSSDVILKIGTSGNITVKGGKSKQLTIIDADGKETAQVYPSYFTYDAGKTAVTLASGFTGTLAADAYESTVEKIDASNVSKAVVLNGNANNNTIIGGKGADKIYGNAGADSLYGGKGNDTLTGGAGNDVFVYGNGDGKDVIADYAAGDSIKISSGTITKTAYSGSNVVFTVGSGTLTVKNGKGKSISITDASGRNSTRTYTSGVSYSASGSNGYWFADDTNFISGENKLDDISAENYSVTNLNATDFENIYAQNSSSVTAITASTTASMYAKI